MEKIHLQIMLSDAVKVISRDRQCSAPKSSEKTEPFTGIYSNPGSVLSKPTKIN
jgi:hypothetical protein